ncbi:APC family permease [Paenarthrobacter nitroguajacolicus]|uniref:APC family permease n=1 Tax=Paenarthrobacter nitroguajacolicus TaxID=211146 RepID=UPI002858651F|nr:APC family permease [Paenarthrobacter nitroguajacolicus]MDR6636981.1 amino acid transporter [Paenarthrobacter nitroguajacolicus]
MTGTTQNQTVPKLRSGTISTRHLVFFVLAAAAPLTVLAGFAPIAYMVGGELAPLGYLIAGLVYLLFSVGFTTMSRYVQNAGAFSAYIRKGLGPTAGSGAALLAYTAYTLGQMGFCAAAGLFASNALQQFLGLSVHWGISAVVIGLATGTLSYFQVNIGARVLSVLLLAEIAILFALAVAVLMQGGPNGFSFTALDPATWDIPKLGSLLVLSFLVYVGFEQTAVYGEEVKAPRTTVPKATYLAVALLTIIYVFMSWIILMAIGPKNLDQALSGDLSTIVFDVNTGYLGGAMTSIMQLLVVTSFIAGVLALQNAGTRYLFSMARDGLMPTRLARVDARTGSPGQAAVVQTTITVVAIIAFALIGLDPYKQVVLWTNTPTILAVLLLQIATSISAVVYLRKARHQERLWNRLIAPVLSAIVMTFVLLLILTQLNLLTALGPVGNVLICVPLMLAIIIGLATGRNAKTRTTSEMEVPA